MKESESAPAIPGPEDIAKIEDPQKIKRLMYVGEILSHYNLSLAQTVELTRRRGYLVIRAGELYGGLKDESGGDRRSGDFQVLPKVTTEKQQAKNALEKSRKTLARWVKMSEKDRSYQMVDDYCNRQLAIPDEATMQGLYHYFFGILASKHTGNQENYTPAWVIRKVKTVLEDIDLDPASCEFAQKVVKARRYYTLEDNGLKKPWAGRVFLNPPYSIPGIALFVDKLLASPDVEAAILLTNNNTDTNWWRLAALEAEAVCFTRGRIQFYTEEIQQTQPTNGQSFFYFGDDLARFYDVFSTIGLIMRLV